jgi:putative photosynthetic complex assembly protein
MSQIVFEPEPGARDAMPQIRVPRGPLLGALAVVVVAASAAVGARVTGVGATRQAEAAGSPVERHALRFADAPDGGILVYDAGTGALAGRIAPGGDGFLRGTLRAMSRGRMLAREGAERPFVLTRWSDGRLTLDDSVTRMHVAVSAFGPTQVASFERVFAMTATR